MSRAPCAVAVVNTFRRAPVLRRLLESLARVPELQVVVVVCRADDEETAQVVRGSPCATWPVNKPDNLGLGAGLADGLRAALARTQATHFLLLDDDTVAGPDTLAELLAALEGAGASAAVPLMVDEAGEIGWFPGLKDAERFRAIRERGLKPEDYVRRCGAAPAAFTWSPWPMLLVSRGAVETFGLPRTDFGFMGEDIEYTLRLSWRAPAVLVPRAVGRHLPPGRKRGAEAYFADCMHLQNVVYIARRLPHGRRLARHLPGSILRFLRDGSPGPSRSSDLLRALWRGGALGRPAGAPGADGFWLAYRKAKSE